MALEDIAIAAYLGVLFLISRRAFWAVIKGVLITVPYSVGVCLIGSSFGSGNAWFNGLVAVILLASLFVGLITLYYGFLHIDQIAQEEKDRIYGKLTGKE